MELEAEIAKLKEENEELQRKQVPFLNLSYLFVAIKIFILYYDTFLCRSWLCRLK